MGLMIFISIFFTIWLFSSKTKMKDLKKVGKTISKTAEILKTLAESADNAAEKTLMDARAIFIRQKLEELKKININRSRIGISEKTIDDFFKDRPELIEQAKKIYAAERIFFIEAQKKPTTEPSEHLLLDIREQAKNLETTDIKNKSTTQRKEITEQEKDLLTDEEKEALVNFIMIRFFLTGQNSMPDISCVNRFFHSTNKTREWDDFITPLNMDELKIKKIKGLYHFTHVDNLKSILTHGLLTRQHLEIFEMKYRRNDENRWDNLKNSISISISHPNHKMFIKYRGKKSKNEWVVIKIKKELLCGPITSVAQHEINLKNFEYLNKAIFCKRNAASFSEKNVPISIRKSYKTFLEMFESPIGMTLPTYTVDNQAEILYESNIPAFFIEAICIEEPSQAFDWISQYGIPILVEPTLFESR